MKAYQVFKGEMDKHGKQQSYLVATYLDKNKAFRHAEMIAQEMPLMGDVLEFDGWYLDNTYASWSAVGWESVTIAEFQEIEITE
jgi:hypothetical protein